MIRSVNPLNKRPHLISANGLSRDGGVAWGTVPALECYGPRTRWLRRPCRGITRLVPCLACLAMLIGSFARAHEHLAAGAKMPEAGAALLFVNAANFAAESGYVFPLERSDSGPYAGFHHAELSFVCLAGTLDFGGPVPFHPALGAHIEAVVESVAGPAGGSFGFWESPGDEQAATELTFSVAAGATNGTQRFPVSENDGSARADPYGHIHGRVYSATLPGLYQVGFRFVDTSANGPGDGPLHTPSPPFVLNFQAGVTIAGITNSAEGIQLTFAAANDQNYILESASELTPTAVWNPVGEPILGNNRLHVITVNSALGSSFFRLRREPL